MCHVVGTSGRGAVAGSTRVDQGMVRRRRRAGGHVAVLRMAPPPLLAHSVLPCLPSARRGALQHVATGTLADTLAQGHLACSNSTLMCS